MIQRSLAKEKDDGQMMSRRMASSSLASPNSLDGELLALLASLPILELYLRLSCCWVKLCAKLARRPLGWLAWRLPSEGTEAWIWVANIFFICSTMCWLFSLTEVFAADCFELFSSCFMFLFWLGLRFENLFAMNLKNGIKSLFFCSTTNLMVSRPIRPSYLSPSFCS